MDNMEIYKMGAEVPKEAQKPINAGRLKGMTDINPMWRIKKLTEMFGPCGFGWYYEIVEERLEQAANNEVLAFVRIKLFVKSGGEWSRGIEGTGGNKMTAKERSGMYNSDECFKMALTDALGVACKSLGIGSKIYFAKDRTKYDTVVEHEREVSDAQIKKLYTIATKAGVSNDDVKKVIKKEFGLDTTKDLTLTQYNTICKRLELKK